MTGPESATPLEPGRWTDGPLPPNVRLGAGSLVTGGHVFKRFRSKLDPALTVGEGCTLDGPHMAVGEEGRVSIGDWSHVCGAVLLCERELRIGSYVAIGWNAAIADTDFHPIAPALRIADAIACSPIGAGRARPPVRRDPVVIEDDVWIGPCAVILKGVRIGAGSVIEPGAMVTRSVPPGSRVAGNPARVVGPADAPGPGEEA
jgi:acetyltransferase-like isoleucine patch superfamily enzyme